MVDGHPSITHQQLRARARARAPTTVDAPPSTVDAPVLDKECLGTRQPLMGCPVNVDAPSTACCTPSTG
jgi:hypothetical protein